jgi:hypothetical protein
VRSVARLNWRIDAELDACLNRGCKIPFAESSERPPPATGCGPARPSVRAVANTSFGGVTP